MIYSLQLSIIFPEHLLCTNLLTQLITAGLPEITLKCAWNYLSISICSSFYISKWFLIKLINLRRYYFYQKQSQFLRRYYFYQKQCQLLGTYSLLLWLMSFASASKQIVLETKCVICNTKISRILSQFFGN